MASHFIPFILNIIKVLLLIGILSFLAMDKMLAQNSGTTIIKERLLNLSQPYYENR